MKHIFLALALVSLGFSSCKEKDTPVVEQVAEIKIGEHDLKEVVLDKGSSRDILLSGGNGKFTATVKDSKVLDAKIDGSYLKLRGLAYGETVVLLRSHDKQKSLTVKVERAEISLTDKEVTLYPGQERQDIKVIGGGDDAVVEAENPEMAITYEWDAKTSKLKLRANHEGEAKLIFRSQDNKPAKELKIIVKADNNVSDQIGFYTTTSKTLRPYFRILMHAYRPGKMVWISASPRMSLDQTRILMTPLKSPQKGAKLEKAKITFINVSDSKFPMGEYDLIVEEVVEAKGLVTLRGQGFKLVVPYDK